MLMKVVLMWWNAKKQAFADSLMLAGPHAHLQIVNFQHCPDAVSIFYTYAHLIWERLNANWCGYEKKLIKKPAAQVSNL
jgi:hypothetical protein